MHFKSRPYFFCSDHCQERQMSGTSLVVNVRKLLKNTKQET